MIGNLHKYKFETYSGAEKIEILGLGSPPRGADLLRTLEEAAMRWLPGA
jgi:hypothetical protein